jgi:hypothetical protein
MSQAYFGWFASFLGTLRSNSALLNVHRFNGGCFHKNDYEDNIRSGLTDEDIKNLLEARLRHELNSRILPYCIEYGQFFTIVSPKFDTMEKANAWIENASKIYDVSKCKSN